MEQKNLFEKVSGQVLVQLGGSGHKVKQVNRLLGPLHHKDETVSSFKEVKYLDNTRHLSTKRRGLNIPTNRETCWTRSMRMSSSGTFLFPRLPQAITLLG